MAPTPKPTRQACAPAWPKDALRVTFGLIWAIDAALKWLPGFRSGYMSLLMAEGQRQPGWLKPWFNFWITLQHPMVDFFVYLSAAIETLIAAALILGFARKLTYISAIAFSLIIWSTAEGFGGPYTSGSTDIGTAVIYAVVFIGLLALNAYAGAARYSTDYWLEQRISWWWRLAEVRRPSPPEPAAMGDVAIAGAALPLSAAANEEGPL